MEEMAQLFNNLDTSHRSHYIVEALAKILIREGYLEIVELKHSPYITHEKCSVYKPIHKNKE